MSGFLNAFIAAILLSISGAASKEALHHGHSLDFALLSGVLSFVLVMPLVLFIDLTMPLTSFALIYLSAVFGTLALYLNFKALHHLDMSVVMPLMNLSVIVVVVLGAVFLGEYLSWRQMAGVLLTVAGAYVLQLQFVANGEANGSPQRRIDWLYPLREVRDSSYVHVLLAGIICMAISTVLVRPILLVAAIPQYFFFSYLFLLVNTSLLFMVIRRNPLRESAAAMRSMSGWTFFAVVSRVASSYFYTVALSLMFVALAETVKRFSALFSVGLGGQLFHEKHLLWRLLASAIMIIGALLAVF